jgi:hypothetical protein
MNQLTLMGTDRMSAIVDRLINIDIAIADFQIETALRIGTNPGFILNSSALTTEI